MKKKFFRGASLVGLLFLAISCGNHEHHDDEDDLSHHHHHHHEESEEGHSDDIVISPEKAEKAGIKSATVKAGSFTDVILVSGKIESAQNGESVIVAQSSGVVQLSKALVEGVQVGAGEALMSINSQDLPDSDPYLKAKIAYDAAVVEFEKGEKLFQNQLITLREYNELKTNLETLRLAYTSLGKNHKNGRQQISSKISGFIQRCFVKNGDFVEVGQPLVQVSQNQKLYLKADVPERYYDKLSVVQSANVKLPSGEVISLADYNGKVVSFGQASSDTYYIPLTFSFENKGKTIPGSFVEVYLLTTPRNNVISLPVSAIVEEQGVFFVFEQEDEDCYEKQEVKIGASNGKYVEILSGVEEGSNIVVSGAYQVKVAGASSSIPGHSHEH